MHVKPASAACQICGAPATREIQDSASSKTHFYCKTHAPNLRPGCNTHFAIRRFSLEPGNRLSRAYSTAATSEEHISFRKEMCELHLLGSDGALTYYVSRLTDIDHFVLWTNEFVDNVREYVVERSPEADKHFEFDPTTVGFTEPLFKIEFAAIFSTERPKITKADRAVDVLLRAHAEISWRFGAARTRLRRKAKQAYCRYVDAA